MGADKEYIIDKMIQMVDGILGDDGLCGGCEYVSEGLSCAACRRKYADKIIKILRDMKHKPQTEDKCKGCIYENGDSLMACVSCQGKVPYDGYEWDEHIPTELASTMLKNRFKEQSDG